MANDLEKQSTDTPEDVLPYAFIEDAISEGDALDSVEPEDLPNGVVLMSARTGMSALTLSDAVAEVFLANANWKMSLATAPNNHHVEV